jgi:kumamolisin
MSLQKPFSRFCLAIAASLLAASLSLASTGGTASFVLQNSVKSVPVWTQAGTPEPHHPYVTRSTLTSDEVAAPMDFEVALKMRNFAELQARVARGEQIPLQEMQAKYDPLASDEQAVADWLTSQGFTITRRDANHLAVFARGTVSQIQKAMQVSFGKVSYEGKGYTSAVTAPSIPANLSGAVLGINGLQPHIQARKHIIMRPNSVGSPNPPFTPGQIAQADNANGLYSSGITGAGQTIAIVIDTFPLKSDLTSFWTTCGINQSLNNISFIQVVSGTLPATSEEETLDTEWSSSMAPGAKVRVYATTSLNSADLDTAYQRVYSDAINNPSYGLHQMSMSYGGGETDNSSSQIQTDDQLFAQLASAGVTCFASSGDGGATPGTASSTDETGPLQVEYPASDPNVTGVGGTSLTLDSNYNVSSETVWNDSSSNYGATGGGTSIYFSRPTWQTGTGVPSGTMRLVPDVACPADPFAAAELYYNGALLPNGVGGTSWSSPTWAGYCALINQARANAGLSSLGLLGPQIYSLIGTTNFRDITSGNNATATSGSTNGIPNYTAGTGYDECTGIGVPLVQTLSQTLVGTSTQPRVQIQLAFQDVVPGQSATITALPTGSPVSYQWQRMPIGTTTWSNLSDNGTYSGSATASLTVTGATTSMSGDQFQCVVTYASTSVTSPSSSLVVDTPYTIINTAGVAGTSGNVNSTNPSSAEFSYPSGVALDSSGDLYIADTNNNCIREITPAGVVTTPYGNLNGHHGSATNATGNNAHFYEPNAIASDGAGDMYVADTDNNRIQKIVLSTQVVTTFASGLNAPNGVAVDGSGNVYVADTNNDVIEKISSGGTVSTLAGQKGTAGYVNATGTLAEFNSPTSVAVDSSGNVYVADFNNDVIRKITSAGVVSLFAGQPGTAYYLDGVASKSAFSRPIGVAVDGLNNLFVADSLVPTVSGTYTSTAGGNDLLRRISTAGVVSTIAGQPGTAGSATGTGTTAQFYSLQSVTPTSTGEVYLADTYNHLIRAGGIIPAMVTPPVGQVITIGQPVTFAVTASGTASLSYQWLKNGTAISGATGSTYTISSVASTDAGNYAVTVTNSFGNVTSAAATLIPVNSQPVAQNVSAGQSVTFSISVAGPGPLTYQWLFNGTAISGATGSSYTIASAASGNAGNYSVVVSDGNGIVTTSPVSLTVSPAVASDTPTMPPVALIVLVSLLFFVATRHKVSIS